MQVFGRRDFQFLYNDCFTEHDRGNDGVARFLRITDEGVFYDDCLQEGGKALKSLRWKPVHELAGPNKPPSSGPALPFPFTANELAAFMLWGYWASDFQNAFGQLECGPKGFVLNGDHEDAADAYEALRQAYEIYRDALHVVGELDQQEQQHAYDLLAQYDEADDQALKRERVNERVIIGKHKNGNPEYGGFIATGDDYFLRLARAKESVAVQKAQALQAKEQADAKQRDWRRAMTRQLLPPQAITPSPAKELQAAPVVAVGASDGVEPGKSGPKGGGDCANVPKSETRQAVSSPKFSMRLNALIEAHIHEWPTIKTDIKGASGNGLSAAKAGARGWWEERAMEWARANGKLVSAAKPADSLAQAMHNMRSLPSRQNRLEG